MAKTKGQIDIDTSSMPPSIQAARIQQAKAISVLHSARNAAAAIPVTYAETIAEVATYPNGNSYEGIEKQKVTEFVSEAATLQAEIEVQLTALGETF